MSTLTLIRAASRETNNCVTHRLMLYPGELYRVPAANLRIRVTSGFAHVTQAGRDIVLGRGETAQLDAGRDVALVSALKGQPLVMELCDRRQGQGDVLML